MKRFESGEALAKEFGLPPAVLKKTFDDYNQSVRSKKDPFGKKVGFCISRPHLILTFMCSSSKVNGSSMTRFMLPSWLPFCTIPWGVSKSTPSHASLTRLASLFLVSLLLVKWLVVCMVLTASVAHHCLVASSSDVYLGILQLHTFSKPRQLLYRRPVDV